jgi:PncC family amidohydrolase
MNFKTLVNNLEKNNMTISTIESLTGGGFAYFFTQTPGASSVFRKAIVTYSNEAKIEAGVDKDVLKQFGAVSREVALEMVQTLDTDVAISFTGNAGPAAMDDQPVGKVFIGIKFNDEIEINEFDFEGTREEIRQQSIEQALKLTNKKFQNI